MQNKPSRFDPAIFAARRARLAAHMHGISGGVAIIPTAPELARNRDNHYLYRHDSYFHYLTGFCEPESVLVLIAGESPKSILFCRSKKRRTRDLGWLPSWPRSCQREIRIRRSLPHRRICAAHSRRTRRSAFALVCAWLPGRLGRQGNGGDEQGPRGHAHWHSRAGRYPRRSRTARRNAPVQG